MTDQWEQPTDEPGWIEPKIEDDPIYHLLKEGARIEQEIQDIITHLLDNL